MVVQGVLQKLTKYAGQGVVLGGALYYSVKEYGFFNSGRVDLLKDSYRNLKNTLDTKKVGIFQYYIMSCVVLILQSRHIDTRANVIVLMYTYRYKITINIYLQRLFQLQCLV